MFGGSDCHDIELTGNLESRAIAVVSSRSTLQAVRASTCYQLGHSISANFWETSPTKNSGYMSPQQFCNKYN